MNNLKEVLFKTKYGFDMYAVKTCFASVAIFISITAFILLLIHLWK